jgi:tetratricopeptide (TPR) repeat protein
MKRSLFCVICFVFLLCPITVFAETEEEEHPFVSSIEIVSGVTLPSGEYTDQYRLGSGTDLVAYHTLRSMPIFQLHALLGYNYIPLKVATSLSVLNAGAGVGVYYEVIPRLGLEAHVEGGYYFGLLNNNPASYGGSFFLNERAGVTFKIVPSLRIGAEFAFRNHFGLNSDFRFSLVVGYLPKQKKVNTLRIENVEIEPVYPQLYTHYNENPIGRLVYGNTGGSPLRKVKTMFLLQGSVENETVTELEKEIPAETKLDTELICRFPEEAVTAKQECPGTAKIGINHIYEGWKFSNNFEKPITVVREEIPSFDKPQSIAPFVSSKDPTVRELADFIHTAVYEQGVKTIDRNLLKAAGAVETLAAMGFKTTAANRTAIQPEGMKFPREVIADKGGNNVETTALFCALMEALDVPSAYLPVDGAELAAVRLRVSSEEMEASFSHPETLIVSGGGVWVPLRLDELDKGFFHAWTAGAAACQGAAVENSYQIFPVRLAWNTYFQTGYSNPKLQFAKPSAEKITESTLLQMEQFIQWETAPRVKKYQALLDKNPRDLATITKLGAVYAKYGRYNEAVKYFEEVLLYQEYPAALVNQGNVLFLQGKLRMALPYFDRAYSRDPFNAVVLLGLARVNHALENYGNTEFAYEKLKSVDAELAEQFNFLMLRGEAAAEKEEREGLRRKMIWLE